MNERHTSCGEVFELALEILVVGHLQRSGALLGSRYDTSHLNFIVILFGWVLILHSFLFLFLFILFVFLVINFVLVYFIFL